MKRLINSHLSIRQRLPLLICVLLLSVILIFGLISYVGVRKADLKVGEERLRTLTEQLSTMLAGNTHSFIATAHEIGDKSAIKKYLLSNGKDSAREVLNILQSLRKDTSYVQVELRDENHTRLLTFSKNKIEIDFNIDSVLSVVSMQADSGAVGKLYRNGGSVYYPVVATVMNDQKLTGYLVRWKLMGATPKALAQLSKLLGADAKLYIGNTDGVLWTDLSKAVAAPPLYKQKGNEIIKYSRSKSNRVIASVRPIPNSNWLVVVELSEKKILEAANQFLYWLILAGIILLIAGIFAAWLMSRKISEPLARLTFAASEIEAGNYSTLVDVGKNDELGKLAHAFNAMTVQVQTARKELEKRAENYKLLFENNPMPMWIISLASLDIISVNEAAINHYGYSREEFLQLNARNLRPQEDVERYISYTNKERVTSNSRGIWRHKKKDNTVIMVDVIANDILYHDVDARLILANDITEKLNAEAELVRHRIMQQELIKETTIQVQEKERDELGKELHDNINQILASTKLYLEMARNGNEQVMFQAIEKSYENVNLAIAEIRHLSKQLVAPSLDANLVDAVRNLSEEIQAITPITFSLITANFEEHLLNDNIRLMLYRIIQEQINNVLKHAAANNVIVTLETAHGIVYLIIADNGIGFNTANKSKGIGLKNIENRVTFYDGVVNIISQPGKGTRLEISVPIERSSKLAI
jgi:PAS domain S-box-containing protein